LIPGKDIDNNVCDLCINWWVVYIFVSNKIFGFWIFFYIYF
jgi:hypothetical protein